MNDIVQDKIKKERSERLHNLSEEKKFQFYRANMGTLQNVLFESGTTHGMMHGFTENYIKVNTSFRTDYMNQVIRLTLGKIDRDGNYLH